jgi:23S rRNA pseudouridine2605 synthase
MRLNKFLALYTGISRRSADTAVDEGRVLVNNLPAAPGQNVEKGDEVRFDDRIVTPEVKLRTIILNKPEGYVVSRAGQGSKTIYELLPNDLHHLKPVGRLDKDSSGLLLLTNDGHLAQELTHPKFTKQKVYEISLDKTLEPLHQQMISDYGIELEDGKSRLQLEKINDDGAKWRVVMAEGRNRQIRRTFAAIGYSVGRLHRTQFGPYRLGDLGSRKFIAVTKD